VPEQGLAVLAAHPHPGLAGGVEHRAGQEVGDVGVELAPLGGEDVDEVDPLGLGLQQRGRRRDEVHMGVGRHPARAAQVEGPLQLEDQLRPVGGDLHAAADRAVLEALDDLGVHRVQLFSAGRLGEPGQGEMRAPTGHKVDLTWLACGMDSSVQCPVARLRPAKDQRHAWGEQRGPERHPPPIGGL